MFIWHIERIAAAHYDELQGVVVVAENVQEARKLAEKQHADEAPEVWLRADFSQAHKLGVAMPGVSRGVSMLAFHAG